MKFYYLPFQMFCLKQNVPDLLKKTLVTNYGLIDFWCCTQLESCKMDELFVLQIFPKNR